MQIPHPIPYQGSKRNLAPFILSFFPESFSSLVEPFAGSAAISIAAAVHGKASHFHLNDINRPLMHLWDEIINRPGELADAYGTLWLGQKGRERRFYDEARDEFNRTERPDLFLYLLARCVKGSIRYNSEGHFNQSPDNRRKGRRPENMRRDILAVSNLLKGKAILTNGDYHAVFASVAEDDLVYMDPPYQGVSLRRDSRYASVVGFEEFIDALRGLVERGISFILSYDGRTGKKVHGRELPRELALYHMEVQVGRSTQYTLNGRSEITYESVYLSEALVKRLPRAPDRISRDLYAEESLQLSMAI